MGRRPDIAEPTASPVSAASDVGVSRTRCGYFSCKPVVVPPAPCGTPKPSTKTRLSRARSCSVASFIASAYLIIFSRIHVGVEFILLGEQRLLRKRDVFEDRCADCLFE